MIAFTNRAITKTSCMTYRTGQIIELSVLNNKTVSSLKTGGVYFHSDNISSWGLNHATQST